VRIIPGSGSSGFKKNALESTSSNLGIKRTSSYRRSTREIVLNLPDSVRDMLRKIRHGPNPMCLFKSRLAMLENIIQLTLGQEQSLAEPIILAQQVGLSSGVIFKQEGH